MDRLLLTNCRLPEGGLADVLLQGGEIAEVSYPGALQVLAPAHDVAGRLLTPGLTDPHLHPDKAFGLSDDRVPATNVGEAIARLRQRKPLETAEAVYLRTLRLLRLCLGFGTTRVRLHAEVDPLLGLRSVEGVLAARDEMAGQIHAEVVAFPQEGIVKEPGTLELMRQALSMGCDVVGAITYQDPDAGQHLEMAAGLAREFDAPLDVHADFCVPVETSQIEAVAAATLAYGLDGRVTLGHCTTLARMSPAERELILRSAQGISAARLADELGISPGAVRTRLHRARRRLEAATA